MTSISPSWARVGVRCVKVRIFQQVGEIPPCWIESRPRIGEKLTIRAVEPHPINGTIGLRFLEHVNPVLLCSAGLYEIAFDVRCYAPLVSRTESQDVAAIKKLVDELPILERAMLYEEVLNEQWSER